MDKIKAFFIGIGSAITSFLGILAVPVFLLVGCNIIDYVTGIIASCYKGEKISSYKGIKGIFKKVCQWLLIIVGAMLDELINYALNTTGLNLHFSFVISIVVAMWLVVNEIISILENITYIIGEDSMPPFLMPIVRKIKKATEDSAKIDKEDEESEE